jgi:hypothetical protein
MFESYLKLGVEHILDPNGLDHVLFIVVLTAPFLLKDWKKVILLATAFTLGHSLTLALAALDIIKLDSTLIEILIAVSICLTAVFNFLNTSVSKMSGRYTLAAFFGLIHGMGFSNFFKSILGKDDIVLPLLAFNIGVEVAQVIIVIVVLALSQIWVKLLRLSHSFWVSILSSAVFIWSLKLIIERL